MWRDAKIFNRIVDAAVPAVTHDSTQSTTMRLHTDELLRGMYELILRPRARIWDD